jgi:hypothetical protein
MKSILMLIPLGILLIGCTTSLPHGSKTNGIIYLSRSEFYLNSCKNLGTIVGIPASLWGGKIGNSQARINALEKARQMDATHFLETQTNWADVNVQGIAYKCSN